MSSKFIDYLKDVSERLEAAILSFNERHYGENLTSKDIRKGLYNQRNKNQ